MRRDPGRTFRIAKGIFVVHRNDRILLRGVWVIKMGLAGVRVKWEKKQENLKSPQKPCCVEVKNSNPQ